MTTLPERPNPAREQFLAIMRERQGLQKPSTKAARETVQAWRNSILALNESKRNIAAPLKSPKVKRVATRNRPVQAKRGSGVQGNEARAFIKAQTTRPMPQKVARMFGLSAGYAYSLIKQQFGAASWAEKMEAKLGPVREYLAKLDERPCVRAICRQFHIEKRFARQVICDQFGGGADEIWATGRKVLREIRQRQAPPRPKKVAK